ncbi:hypothetical protein OZX73_00510 [Bifidobacterium sp. ESL0775]|uniref:hypothetical protein n=1 Tax=Bifidobacterium sp. ESL0775 TaxID=2983230 RepID=UPI0023F71BCD|nr:hypothetical protein [Bifidobacterium sp. ESL0775]WEV69416.1 hypothetical protein OZX73_00510 [Bifidobacterium sp. ESL0775]
MTTGPRGDGHARDDGGIQPGGPTSQRVADHAPPRDTPEKVPGNPALERPAHRLQEGVKTFPRTRWNARQSAAANVSRGSRPAGADIHGRRSGSTTAVASRVETGQENR